VGFCQPVGKEHGEQVSTCNADESVPTVYTPIGSCRCLRVDARVSMCIAEMTIQNGEMTNAESESECGNCKWEI